MARRFTTCRRREKLDRRRSDSHGCNIHLCLANYVTRLYTGTIACVSLTCVRVYIHVYEYWVINLGGILILVSSKWHDNGDTCAAITENLCRRIPRRGLFRRIDAGESQPASSNVQPIDFATVYYPISMVTGQLIGINVIIYE